MTSDQSPEALLQKAKDIAQRILDGKIAPNEGCSELGEICQELDYPTELAAFGLLAHEQYNHEFIGITAENCIPDILKECKTFLGSPA